MKSASKPISPAIQRLPLLNAGINQALGWVEDTQQQTPRFALEAQTVMLNLRRCRIQLNHLASATAKNGALGFYGRSPAAKMHLITALAAAEPGYLTTVFAGKTLDFLSHIRSQQAAGVAIRFSHRITPQEADYPVQLTLLTEAELVRLLARAGNAPQPIEKAQIGEIIDTLVKLRQSQAVAGISAEDVIAIWDSLRAETGAVQQTWDSEYWPQALSLAPYLAVDERARLFSPLWGNDPALIECYRRLAYRLQQLGGSRRVMAPLTVLTDEIQQPANALLALNTSQERVQIRLQNGDLMPITLAELSLLTAELLIPLQGIPAHSGFTHIDLLDLPAFEAENASLPLPSQRLQQAKSLVLLQRYTEQRAMQALIVCNAATCREEAAAVGPALDYWAQQHRGKGPGLIWAFTPHDQRSTAQYDQAVQRYVGEPGEVWGTLLARDEDDIRRMADYLATAVKGNPREQLLAQQFNQLEQDLLANRLGRWLEPADNDKAQIAKDTVKALQARTSVHGELLEHLLPARHALQQLYWQQQQLKPKNDDPLAIDLDLFDDEQDRPLSVEGSANFVLQVQRLWITQLRGLDNNCALLSLLAVEPATLATLADELITASFRLDLWQRLGVALAETDHQANHRSNLIERQIASTLTLLGDFIAWLGFQSLPLEQRPESRINRGHKIFTKPTQQADARLTQLPSEPVNNTALYIYDWLVGLHTLIGENAGYGGAQTLNERQRAELGRIVQGMR
ncbi:virulence factor SrfC family protein [Serratia sp. L9]|uniref:virulence factor SrfC family protein n=1 Tax=Serratia sp. L9 TaxID=3423946 RepID=UPI003D67C323